MSSSTIRPASLVLYKNRPARVVGITDKIDIDLGDGKAKRVRDKDVVLLHPGPCQSLRELAALHGDLREAWELAAGEELALADLAGLVFGEYSPASAWATWQAVADGVYFEGEPGPTDRPHGRAGRRHPGRARVQGAGRAGVAGSSSSGSTPRRSKTRTGSGSPRSSALRWGGTAASRVMQALGRQETPQNAHRLLVSCGYWAPSHNPWPARESAPLVSRRSAGPRAARRGTARPDAPSSVRDRRRGQPGPRRRPEPGRRHAVGARRRRGRPGRAGRRDRPGGALARREPLSARGRRAHAAGGPDPPARPRALGGLARTLLRLPPG